jgi:D-glycero-alpha-D-manno-heptose-7-phosphate kinase
MKDSEIKNKVTQNVKLTYEMKNNLLKGKLNDLGRNLNQAWELKKQFSNQITTNEIDKIYDFAMQNGAIGGKLLGAGGGGYFLFFVPPFNKLQLLSALKKQGYNGKSFKFTEQGLTSWTVRINK